MAVTCMKKGGDLGRIGFHSEGTLLSKWKERGNVIRSF